MGNIVSQMGARYHYHTISECLKTGLVDLNYSIILFRYCWGLYKVMTVPFRDLYIWFYMKNEAMYQYHKNYTFYAVISSFA